MNGAGNAWAPSMSTRSSGGSVADGSQSSELAVTGSQLAVAMPTEAQYARIASNSPGYGVTLMWRVTPRRRMTIVLSPAPVSRATAAGGRCASRKWASSGLMPQVATPPCTIGGRSTISSSGIMTGPARRPRRPEAVASGSIERHDAARHLPRPQRREPLVDLLDLVGPAHQLVDLQALLHVQLDEAREVQVGPHRAVHRALQALLLQGHHVRRHRRPYGHGRHADDHRGAAGADGVHDLQR